MKKVAIVLSGDLNDRKGYINAVISRIIHLKAIAKFQIDVFCISLYDSFLLGSLRRQHKNVLDRKSIVVIDGLKINIRWIPYCLFDAIFYKFGYRQLFMDCSLKRICKDFKTYDLICAHSNIPGKFAFIINKKWRIPFCVTWHGSDINILPNRSSYYMRQTSLIMETAKVNFFVSKKLCDVSNQITTNCVKMIAYNGAEERFAKFSQERRIKLRKYYGVPLDCKIVAFVGSLLPIKNVLSLPSIFELIKKEVKCQIKFWIIGDGNLRHSLEKEIKNLNLVDDVKIWGNQPVEKMPDLMNCIDLLLLPSLNEGLPLVVLEALSCGANVLGSNVGGISEVIGSDFVINLGDEFIPEMSKKAISILNENIECPPLKECFSWKASAQIENYVIEKNL